MNPETEKLLRDLAESLGTTVEKLWAVMVQGQIAMGYRALAMVAAAVVIMLIGNHYYRKASAMAKAAGQWDEPHIPMAIASVVAMLFSFIFGLYQFHEALTRLISPEYSALAKIAEWTSLMRR